MKQKILILLALFSITIVSKAQDTEFWFAAPDLSEQSPAGQAPIILVVSNASAMTGTVTVTFQRNGSPQTITGSIPANGLWSYTITAASLNLVENPRALAGTVTKYGIHIETTIPVIAYYQLLDSSSMDLYALKGSAALGTEFYVPMIHNSYYYSYTGVTTLYDQIDIVAIEDGTTVTVVPTKEIRMGASGSSPAGTSITRTLDEGETLKIMEHVREAYAGSPSLGGTKITSDKPIAVTTTEDFIGTTGPGHDLVGDQIVPIDALGKEYIVVKGFLVGSDRAYIIATVDGTTISVNSGGTPTVSPILNAGDRWVFDLGNGGYTDTAPLAVLVSADHPIYCYHVSGTRVSNGGNELGSALLPSIYSIGQTQLSFYQDTSWARAFVVFRTGAHDKFLIRHDTGSYSPVNVTPIPVPGNNDWQAARIVLPTSGQGRVVTLRNSHSPFSLGYFNSTSGGASYGYLSAFGDFKFPYDIIYKCLDGVVTLEGGYASSYKWEYSTTESGTYTPLSETGYSIVVGNEGYYKLTMNQDPKLVSDIIEVRNLDFQATIQPAVSPADVTTTFSATINPAIASDPNLKISYLWEFEGATQSNSTDATPTVTWNSANRSVKLTITAEANTSSTTGGCSAIVFKALPTDMDDCAHKLGPITCNFTLPGTTTYQWQSRAESSATWIDITGATTNTYTPVNQRRGITYYRPMVKDETNTVYSDPVKVRVRSCRLPVNHNISVMGYYD